MTKHEAPPFNMVIEAGRLIPATPYDAERLDSYRRGTRVKVRFTEEKDRVLVRKWWTIVGKAVKECNTPWKTRDEASEAIKLALGIVNLAKTVSGAFMQYPKSLTELTDPELQEAVEQMMALIHRITGVDPDEWRKQIGDLGRDDEPNIEPSETPHASDAGNDAAPNSVVSDHSAQAATEPGDSSSPPTAELSGSTSLTDEDRDHLLAFIRRLKASIGDDETVVLATGHSFAAEGKKFTDLGAAKAASIVKYFRAVCRKEMEAADAIELACGIAQVDILELGMI
ncbi:hypothetical protein HQ945_09005 [Phyllobacterium sp. BT25]|uniref:Uncharacterized protein n=1 Tax=Phyllobacterium pellucidum TaxID=2740464 RepID=A0A849VTN5_9HYPH|nr:hypothetical protein [Phyllobacterium pellucidum]NTS31390.1 hypothetical protein [Phyllobacterium pellucidum]